MGVLVGLLVGYLIHMLTPLSFAVPPWGIALAFLELAPDRPHLLAQLDAQADGVVPQHFAGFPLHHLRADIERGEQRIERRSRGMQYEELIEAAMLDPDLSKLGESAEADVIRAELGYGAAEPLLRYTLA